MICDHGLDHLYLGGAHLSMAGDVSHHIPWQEHVGVHQSVANRREHGTTRQPPQALLAQERTHLGPLPERSRLTPYLREDRKVDRAGYVHWDGSRYGVPWSWAGMTVQMGAGSGTVEIWSGSDRLAVHPRAQRPGQRFTLPGQWDGLINGDGGPRKEAVAMQVAAGEVERRSLEVYELAAGGER